MIPKIYMYYGNLQGVADQWDVEGTWTSNYAAVWHLSEDPSTTNCGSDEICDSTSNDNDGNMSGSMTSGDSVTGKIGDGIDFDGSDDAFQVTQNIVYK